MGGQLVIEERSAENYSLMAGGRAPVGTLSMPKYTTFSSGMRLCERDWTRAAISEMEKLPEHMRTDAVLRRIEDEMERNVAELVDRSI